MHTGTIQFIALIWGIFIALIIGFIFFLYWYVTKYNRRKNSVPGPQFMGSNFNPNGTGKNRFEGWAIAAEKLPSGKKLIKTANLIPGFNIPNDLFNPPMNLTNEEKQNLLERLEIQILDLNIGLQQLGIGSRHGIMQKIDDLYRIFQTLRRTAKTQNYNPDYMVDLIYYQMIYNLTHDLKPFNTKYFYSGMHDMLVHATFEPINRGTISDILRHRYNEIIANTDMENQYEYSEHHGIPSTKREEIRNAMKETKIDGKTPEEYFNDLTDNER